MHEITIGLTDAAWDALRGHHTDGGDLSDSEYISRLIVRESARTILDDESIRALLVALAERRGEHAQG